MTTSSPTTPHVRIRSRIAGWLPTSRRRRLLAVTEAYRLGLKHGHDGGYQDGRDDG